MNSWFDVAGTPTFENEYYNTANFVDRSEQWLGNKTNLLVKNSIYLSGLQKYH